MDKNRSTSKDDILAPLGFFLLFSFIIAANVIFAPRLYNPPPIEVEEKIEETEEPLIGKEDETSESVENQYPSEKSLERELVEKLLRERLRNR